MSAPGVTERDLGRALLTIARSAIGERFGICGAGEPCHAGLTEPGATFVTLKRSGELRGCIGSLKPIRLLHVDVRANAVAAAFRDPRFPPLTAAEFRSTSVEVSLLSADERLDAPGEADLVASLRPGVDGVILEYGRHRATFLPQVWETLADPRAFMAALKRKAGLPEDFWSPRVDVSRYGVTKWAESEFLLSEEER